MYPRLELLTAMQGDLNKPLQRSQMELSQPIVLCDVSANRWWSMLYCNDAFTKCTGMLLWAILC